MHQNVISIDRELLDLNSRLHDASLDIRKHVAEILKQAERIQYQHGIAEAKLALAHLLWEDMVFDRANVMIKEVIQFAKKDGAQNLLAEAYHLSALIFVAKGRYTLSLSQWLKSLKLLQTVQHPTLAIDVMIGLGNMWAIAQQNEKTLIELNHAFQLANTIQSPLHAAKAGICLSRECIRLGQYEEALATLEQAEQQLRTFNNPTWLAEIYNYRARTWLALGQAERAQQECLIAWQAIENNSLLVWAQCLTLITLAQVDLARHHNPLPNINQANELADRYHLHSFQSQIALIRAQYAEQQGLWDEALASYKRYRQLDLGDLAQQHQQGTRDFSSLEFLRLAQQIDVYRQKKPAPKSGTGTGTGTAICIPHNYLARYIWQQQLAQLLADNTHLGIIFIRLPIDNARFPWQRMLYLMATIGIEDSRFCHYDEGLFAFLTTHIQCDEFKRYQHNIANILQLLPFAANTTMVAATHSQAGDTLKEVLGRIETLLYPQED